MIHLLLGASHTARDELHSLRDAVGTRGLYVDVLWVARDEKQGVAEPSRSGPCERTMGIEPTTVSEESRVKIENLPLKFRRASQ